MMFGEKSIELIKVLTRESGELIGAYNSELVDMIVQEMKTLYDHIQQFKLSKEYQLSPDTQLYVAPQIRYAALLWNKRCLTAYHYARLMKLKKLRWEFGSLLPDEIRQNLSDAEMKWFVEYCNNLSDFMNKLNDGKGLDLTLYKKPPKRLYIQVRCLVEYGDFELDDGTTVIFSKDSMHYLPLSQCEKLIHQGVLEQITH